MTCSVFSLLSTFRPITLSDTNDIKSYILGFINSITNKNIDFVEELRKLNLSRYHCDRDSSAIYKLFEEFKQLLNLD